MTVNHNELLKKVNPIYFSAKGCLILLAETGDPDLVNFYKEIDKEQLIATTAAQDPQINRGRIISLDVRYNLWNAIAEETDCQTIVDLPCGYLPHCLTAARLKKNYYGFDLPIVTDEISSVASKLMTAREKSFVHYHGVDATNYFSMRNALNGVEGKICIITDGLLGYFNRTDLKVVCENVHRLLREFGGCWYTSDSEFTRSMSLTYAALTGGDKDEMLAANDSGRRQVADSDNDNEIIFSTGTLEERRRFMEACGFSVKSFRYPDKLRVIPSLKDEPALMNKILSVYGDIEEWVLTAEETSPTEQTKTDLPFAQKFSLSDGVLSVRLRGRLDTITAPELLQAYEEHREKFSFAEIKIDAAELSYISYGGLRVLKIMCDDLEDSSRFKILNAGDDVKKILATDFPDEILNAGKEVRKLLSADFPDAIKKN